MTTSSRYFVWNENTLCYQAEGDSRLGVLHGSVIRGGRNWRDGCFTPTAGDVLRDATLEDFREYRCQPPRGLFSDGGDVA
ncbi:hypothetical protein [Rhodanobacter sp. FW106-PBR-LB-2-11]|uniref:hypothetical protein n=1 Tax=Rhodanobacter sp. FW106-PBR-LB-2-11 TaxID=1524463 RepID=UPI0034E39B90